MSQQHMRQHHPRPTRLPNLNRGRSAFLELPSKNNSPDGFLDALSPLQSPGLCEGSLPPATASLSNHTPLPPRSRWRTPLWKIGHLVKYCAARRAGQNHCSQVISKGGLPRTSHETILEKNGTRFKIHRYIFGPQHPHDACCVCIPRTTWPGLISSTPTTSVTCVPSQAIAGSPWSRYHPRRGETCPRGRYPSLRVRPQNTWIEMPGYCLVGIVVLHPIFLVITPPAVSQPMGRRASQPTAAKFCT